MSSFQQWGKGQTAQVIPGYYHHRIYFGYQGTQHWLGHHMENFDNFNVVPVPASVDWQARSSHVCQTHQAKRAPAPVEMKSYLSSH